MQPNALLRFRIPPGGTAAFLHTIHNARVQLLATAMNNLALAVLVAGFAAPVITGQLQSAGRAIVGLACPGFSITIHTGAQVALEGLRP